MKRKLMHGLRVWVVCLLSLCLCGQAWAWEAHHDITHLALLGFRVKNAAIWKALNTPVQVTPIEEFLNKAFGVRSDSPAQTLQILDRVLNGIGVGYRVHYVEGMRYTFNLNWAAGISHLVLHPIYGSNSEAIGRWVKPLDVVTTYSDEPDWLMDDDVPRLKGKGPTKNLQGTGSRILRHFWYKGETHFGVDFGKDQETDKRMQLMYNMSLIAFSVGEPYWGYRYMADSMHYLQDMTQPFHIHAVISNDMIDPLELIRAGICDLKRSWGGGSGCPANFTVHNMVIKYGWIIGAYHALYEDLVRGMLEGQTFDFGDDVADYTNTAVGEYHIENLPWKTATPLLNMRAAIVSAQKIIYPYSGEVGDLCYKTFGSQYRFNVNKTREAVTQSGSTSSYAYEMGYMGPVDFTLDLKDSQIDALKELYQKTKPLLARAGYWTRGIVRNVLSVRAMEKRNSNGVNAQVNKLKYQYQQRLIFGAREL